MSAKPRNLVFMAVFSVAYFENWLCSIKDVGHPHEEMYGTMPEPETMEDRGRSECPAVEQEHGSEELLPCSIRCPAMAGEIPTLQCKRCLCLYHPECLALPPNLNFTNFLCAVSISSPVAILLTFKVCTTFL